LSVLHRVHGVKVLKAVSSPVRLQILNLLFDRGLLSYTELMSSLKMNPSRDAGRFAYHLKFLLKADLIEADVEARKYCLTELGKMVIDIADRIEKKAFKPKSMLVRTSRFALEEFDANKIANSLVREAQMPAELAQKVAKEAEKRLLRSKTKYFTAPLVREVVNALLIEKGLEEYRHKLTRLGLPVHEVTALVKSKAKAFVGSSSIHELAGETVLNEYTLLNVFPRDIADAHLSGSLYIEGLSSWILKPSEIVHDLRFFLQKGLNLEKINAFQPSYPPPESFESALSLALNVLLHSVKEINRAQTFDYFNISLAPFIKGLDSARIKNALRLFISSVNQHAQASICLELTIPHFVAQKSAFGPSAKSIGKYGDFVEESQLLASLLLEIFAEECTIKPVSNPQLILKMRPETFSDERAKAILLKAHTLASEKGVLFFANLSEKSHEFSVFSASGCKLEADLNKDWETDTLRTGCLGSVTINMPRIAYECGKDRLKFFAVLKERLEMATRALEIKYRILKQYSKGLLPFVMQSANGDQYFRLESCARVVNFAGFKEAVEVFCEKSISDEKSLDFAGEVVQIILACAQRTGRRHKGRLVPSMMPSFEASERLAQLDIERYGIGKVRVSGTREKPFYSTIMKFSLQDGNFPLDFLKVERKLSGLKSGGSLTVIGLGELERKSDELMSLTRQIAETHTVRFFTYDRKLTYCTNCRRSLFGLAHKCPSCGSTSTLTIFDRFALA